MVLFAADFAVVFGGGLEELVAAVGREGAHEFSGGLHGFRVGHYVAKEDLRG